MKRLILSLVIFTLSLAFFTTAAQAATVGYWRFEGNFNNETGTLAGAGGNLSASGAITTTVLAGSGRTSDFFNPIPQSGDANGSTGAGFGESRRLSTPDSLAFDLSLNDTFTIEAMINPGNISGVQVIAGNWIASDGNRAWLFVLEDAQLRLRVSSNGVLTESYLSTAGVLGSITAQTDYYVAASFSTAGATLYLQDLTNGGDLLSQDFAVTLAGVVNPNAPFTIGAYGSNANPFTGYIDEVRLSNTVLEKSELLVVPEPSSCVLLAAGMVFVCLRLRRRLGN